MLAMTTNIIIQCIKLFDLLPTTPLYEWSIAADYVQEEQDIEITSNAFREGIFTLGVIDSKNGTGYGYGDGNSGSYFGFGFGNGIGDGFGNGNGHGHGFGTGDGFGNGFGTGDGYGHGHGAGNGFGEGDCG